jgi:hypothetical protein
VVDIGYGQGLLVVVGAGASFDCLPSDVPLLGPSSLPPLTKNLASPTETSNELANTYPDVRPLLAELRHTLKQADDVGQSSPSAQTITFEASLREYLERGAFDEHVRRHVTAMRFYLRDLMWSSSDWVRDANGGITNYTTLVTRCYQWAARRSSHVSFVSFNYDTLLESACRHFGFDATSLDTYTTGRHASVLKPHGSVLWAWPHPNIAPNPTYSGTGAWRAAIQAGEPTTMAGSVIYTVAQRDISAVNHGGGPVPTLPALALPITGKGAFVWPTEQDRFFTSEIPNGSFGRMLTIGWRGAEEHFTQLLGRLVPSNARILVVAGGSDEDTARRDAGITAKNVTQPLGGRPVDLRTEVWGFANLAGSQGFEWILSD